MSDANKAIMTRLYEEVISQGDLELLDELVSPDLVNHSVPPGLPPGIEGFRQQVSMIHGGMPDLRTDVDDMIAEGDQVVTRWTGTGTHQGELMGVAPTGKTITVSGVGIHRIAAGKVVEHRDFFDQLDFMQQLGAIPRPDQGGN
jgi:steroid delta-isomerase-like uncharacterized protein